MGTLHAQKDSTQKFVPKRIIPKATFKINATALVNIFRPALAFSSDIYITRNVVVDVGVGWYFATAEQSHVQESLNGYRQRIGFKYVFLSDRKVGPYIGVETKFNYINSKNIEQLARYGGQYTEMALLSTHIQNYGLSFRGGIHVIPDKKRRFILDLYSGFGYRYTVVKTPSIPPDAELLIFEPLVPIKRPPGRYHLPDFLFGMNLGYCFH